MNTISTADKLQQAIDVLEIKAHNQRIELKNQFQNFTQSLHPKSIIADSIHSLTAGSLTAEPQIKSGITQSVLGLATGYLTKKFLINKSNSTFKNLAGYALQWAITHFINKKQRIKN